MAVDVEVRGRALPGRTSLKERPLALVLETALIAALAVATRLPFRTRYLMNWDAAQFALGLNQFDVVHHQPHPAWLYRLPRARPPLRGLHPGSERGVGRAEHRRRVA